MSIKNILSELTPNYYFIKLLNRNLSENNFKFYSKYLVHFIFNNSRLNLIICNHMQEVFNIISWKMVSWYARVHILSPFIHNPLTSNLFPPFIRNCFSWSAAKQYIPLNTYMNIFPHIGLSKNHVASVIIGIPMDPSYHISYGNAITTTIP